MDDLVIGAKLADGVVVRGGRLQRIEAVRAGGREVKVAGRWVPTRLCAVARPVDHGAAHIGIRQW
jgi:hypothetical protein